MTKLEKITKRIDSFRNEMTDMQIKLCAKPSISPASGGEGEVSPRLVEEKGKSKRQRS